MIAYEFKTEIKEGIIKIPDDYKGNRTGLFKIVIIPEQSKKDKLKKALLKAPVWNDADIENFKNTIQKGYKNWSLEEF